MRVKVITFKPSGKYYTESEEVEVNIIGPWELSVVALKWREEGRIPGLEPGMNHDFHMLVTDVETTILYLFPLGQREVL